MFKIPFARPTRWLKFAAGLALCCSFLPVAQAALFEDDEARRAILDLRQKADAAQQGTAEELRKLRDENTQLGAQLRRSLLELSNQIEVLRSDLSRTRGQEEQLARELAEVQRRQKDMTQGVEDRLKKFEPSKVSVDGQDFMAEPAEIREFEAALATLRKGDFAQAQTAFGDFTRRYPRSGYQPSALFWLGNSQYAQRGCKDAMGNFRAMVAAAPAHLRASEAMLSIANCQVELKDSRGARKTLDELIKAYPQTEAASVAKERLVKLK